MNIYIQTANNYLRSGLELFFLNDFFDKKVSFLDNNVDNIKYADVIIMQMNANSIFICHEQLRHRKIGSVLIILSDNFSRDENELHLCIRDAYFVSTKNVKLELSNIFYKLKNNDCSDCLDMVVNCEKCCFKYLTPSQLLILYALREGYEITEISGALKISIGTVATQIHRVKKNFNLKSSNDLFEFINSVSLRCNFPLKYKE
ncbi:helix-turn-helix transcriptional regulator [Enterobacter huaxiensis]|uniref:helix-turn-helix transcriptional regulator n=1 Tax=Enterobacter huaxiensis TaxID=2494702 RepID=UPI000E73CD86|nr:LuxR C-terminal-related transcriptional regulator [Enterobacter huaxiensis]UNC52651.1 hypothetical protein D5067_0024000 [Enterobacter huaxiensis]